MGLGFVAAQVNLRLQHGALDGEPGLSLADVEAAFHGRAGYSIVTSKIDGGSMEKYIPRPSDRGVLFAWVESGASEAEFEAPAEVLDRLCVRCHHPGGEMAGVPFASSRADGASFQLVEPVTAPDGGMSWSALARSSHAHLFGMGTLYALAGLVFLMTDTRPRWKGICVALPFVAMLLDIGCWWLTKLHAGFAVGVVAGGGLLGVAFAALVLRPLWELVTPGRQPDAS